MVSATDAAPPAATDGALALLAREYEPLKAPTLAALRSRLRGQGLHVPDEDLEAFYNQAWHALYDQLAAGKIIDSPRGFLVEVGFRRAIDDVRKLRPDARADLVDAELAAADDDVVDRLEDQRRLREFAEALRDELGERERVAASLCYVHGYSRREAAELMGVSARRMEKIMDAVSKTVARFSREIQEGTRCEARASVNKAYALGLLDPDGERHAAARAHLDECASCRADVLGMRGLAVVAPPALLPWAALHLTGAAGASSSVAPPRRGRSTTKTAAAAAAAAVVIAAALAFALTRGSDEPDTRPGARPAPSPTAQQPAQSAPNRATPAPSRQSPERKPRAARPPATSRPAPTATPSAEPAPPAPTAVPPAPTPAPAPAAPPEAVATPDEQPGGIIDDGSQEFGLEQ